MQASGNRRRRHGGQLVQKRNLRRPEIKQTFCPLCGVETENSADFVVHLETARHGFNYKLFIFKEHRQRKSKDRHGVKVEVTCGGRELTATQDGTVKTIIQPEVGDLVYEFRVKNTGIKNPKPILITQAWLLHPYKAFKIQDAQGLCDGKTYIRLQQGAEYFVTVSFTNYGIGTYGVPVCFKIDRGNKAKEETKQFDIIRVMVVDVISSDRVVEEVGSQKVSPFTAERWLNMDVTIPGRMPNGRRMRHLLDYSVPKELQILFAHGLRLWNDISSEQQQMLSHIENMFLNGHNLDQSAYKEFFHTLIFLEEHEATRKIEMFNMAHVQLTIEDAIFLKLKVPGLSERRPSVLKGDLIYLRACLGPDEVERRQYEGLVVDVRDTCLCIGGFDPELMDRVRENPSMYFDVHFTLGRFPFFVMHRAIDLLEKKNLFDLVFPTDQNFPHLAVPRNMVFFNDLIKNNEEQRRAVTNIVLGTSRPSSYIIFGPPGTGKTVTVVESILQVKKMVKGSFILVCAPANAACDLLAQKLIPHCTPKELLRLHSVSRDWESVPVDLHSYSNRREGMFYFPFEGELDSYRIIVSTLINSGRFLPKPNTENCHFTHVFIDECGQALEPEALVPIAGVLGQSSENRPGGQVILAGDPMQLGPVCHSSLTEKYELGFSLLEHLMSLKLYQKDDEDGQYDPRFITKLRVNYRSHELILELPNELFYDGDLIAQCGREVTEDTVKILRNNPAVDLPVVFHGVLGHEQRQGRSPSYFNMYELEHVIRYVADLLDGGPSREPIKQKEIGIIAPYIRQVYKLKGRMKELGWEDVEVGTTETFQGREKRVILISTVRSNRNLLDYDGKFQLGFVSNAKRFNVAITRARSLLIIIGNPLLLAGDENWQKLIDFTILLGSYRGCKYMSRSDPLWMKAVLDRVAKVAEE